MFMDVCFALLSFQNQSLNSLNNSMSSQIFFIAMFVHMLLVRCIFLMKSLPEPQQNVCRCSWCSVTDAPAAVEAAFAATFASSSAPGPSPSILMGACGAKSQPGHTHHVARPPAWTAGCPRALWPELVGALSISPLLMYMLHCPIGFHLQHTSSKLKLWIFSRPQKQGFKPNVELLNDNTVSTFCCWLCLYVWNLCYFYVMLCFSILKSLNLNLKPQRMPNLRVKVEKLQYSNFSLEST